MFRALNLIFSPEPEWQKAALKPPHFATALFISLLPVMAIALAVEGWSLVKYGEVFRGLAARAVTVDRAVKYEVFYGTASLLAMFIGGRLIQNVGRTFNLVSRFSVCFILMAYGYFPILLVRLLDALPQINSWICWAVGAALSFRILYHGVALWLRPEQTKGFGLLLVSFLYIVVTSALVHFAAIQVLQGRFLQDVYEPHRSPSLPPTSAEFTVPDKAPPR